MSLSKQTTKMIPSTAAKLIDYRQAKAADPFVPIRNYLLLVTLRIRHVAAGGAVQIFGVQNDASLFWRLFRVQSNLVENLPLCRCT